MRGLRVDPAERLRRPLLLKNRASSPTMPEWCSTEVLPEEQKANVQVRAP